MKSIVFAAGRSRRLGTLTDFCPKSCLPIIEKESFLDRQIRCFLENGFNELVIITGHASEVIEKLIQDNWVNTFESKQFVYNPEFETKNNIYTAFLAKEHFTEDAFIFNSDIVYDKDILKNAVEFFKKDPSQSFIVVDDTKKLVDEDMKIKLDEKRNVKRISKEQKNEECIGEYIGIMHLGSKDIKVFNESLDELIGKGDTDKYYEDALDNCLEKIDLKILSTNALSWAEVDTPEDYERAKNLECVKSQYQTA